MDIFAENRLYPVYGSSIKEHFGGFFDSVFIAFNPFFKIRGGKYTNVSFQKARQISYEELQQKHKVFSKIPKPSAAIYYYDNENYPKDSEMLRTAEKVPWKDIISEAGLKNYSALYKALKTSICGYRKVFQRSDLLQKLNEATKRQQIWHPTEGKFNLLSKVDIFNGLKCLGKNEIVVIDEFYENRKELSLAELDEKTFTEKIVLKDYYIFSRDKEVLFATEWDSFFYLICTSKKNIEEIIEASEIEGFYCDETTKHDWEWIKEEFDKLLELEKRKR